MKVLFSPIGNSDPWRNLYDGPMLNIVRYYNLDKVVLYFTRTIWEGNEKRKGHKAYDWEKIIQTVSPNTEVKIIVEDVENAQDYDAYKEKFHKYLKVIEDSYEDCEIILNVTSGTPQMEATLCLEYIVYPKNKKCVQVSTPTKDSNVGIEYSNPKDDVEEFEMVNEIEKQSEKRCKEIDILSFREAMIRSQILGLIDNYDYEGALTIINQQDSFRNKKKIKNILAEITESIKLHKIFNEINSKYSDENLKKVLFHYLLLQMRFDRNDIAETLIRVKSIAEFLAEYYLRRNNSEILVLEKGKVKLNNENKDFLENYKSHLTQKGKEFKNEKDDYLNLPAYTDIFEVLYPQSELLQNLTHVLNVNGLRNKVAHGLESLSLSQNGSSTQIKNAVYAVKDLLCIIFPNVDNSDFGYFEKKNTEIRELL
ncbi:type III-A CRISPR-associated CARF protein Csm6 [Staphylococcus hominis]|uniref:type III-A CRISPR-associated CARF protein Csm6 n=1 Tax=Staphylococcus hominis TaxID=1290 RepID=UPI0011A8FF78|nr:type III-A CRISPR-associated CARF protein Csm6 [Staphylococcus hominis]